MAKSLKHLSQESLAHGMSKFVNNFTDLRQESKIIYPLHDVVMSGQAMMYFQDKSLLFFQESLQEARKINNLETLFKVETIPKDAQMRNVLYSGPHCLDKKTRKIRNKKCVIFS